MRLRPCRCRGFCQRASSIYRYSIMTHSTDCLNSLAIQAAHRRFAQDYIENRDGDRPFSPAWLHPQWDWNIHLYDRVTSTNQVLWQLFDSQHGQYHASAVAQPKAAIARQQMYGKGQWSRQWLSSPGGLYLSAGLTLHIPVQMTAILTLSTAWGIADALARASVPIGLKWPNDLVIDGRKLGGILIETRLRGDRISRVVIGVGINWTNPIPETGISLHSRLMAQPDSAIDTLNDVAAVVLLGIQTGIERWRQEGSRAIVTAYEAFWVNRGQWVTLPMTQNTKATDKWAPGQSSLLKSSAPESSVPESSVPESSVPESSPVSSPVKGQIIRVHESGNLVIHIPSATNLPSQEVLCAPGTITLGYGQWEKTERYSGVQAD